MGGGLRGWYRRRGGRYIRGRRAVARPGSGSRRLLTRPVAQLDSTRPRRWQRRGDRGCGGASVGGGRCIAFRGRARRSEEGKKGGGGRIDPVAARLTVDETVTRDESGGDGRREARRPAYGVETEGCGRRRRTWLTDGWPVYRRITVEIREDVTPTGGGGNPTLQRACSPNNRYQRSREI